MRDRSLFGALIALSLVVPLTSCSNPSGLDSISVSPTTQSLTTGQTAQLTVTGTYGNSKHTTTQDLTSGVNWSSNTTSVATVSAAGLVTAVGAGSATITASAQGFAGQVTSSAAITVTSSGGGSSGGTIVGITVTPGAQSIAGAGNTVQFIAIGTTSSGATVNLTNQAIWTSSATSIASIGATTGLATSVGAGTTTITALYSDVTAGTTVTGTASLTVTGGSSTSGYTALSLIPSSQSVSATGQTGQFVALGTNGAGTVIDVTDNTTLLTWYSSSPSVATISPTGLVTGVSTGSTTITALLTNPNGGGVVSATATVSVSVSSPVEPILSLEIIPSSITVNDFNLSGQFLAIATYSVAPYVKDVTNESTTTWLSSEPNFFPVSNNTGGGSGASAGIVTAEGAGGATIIAESASTDSTIETATATFSCPQVLEAAGSNTPPSCPDTVVGGTGNPLLSTLTVYQRGLNTTTWEVTAPSATGTADVLHCGPGWTGAGGSVCTATYPVGTTVTLTSPAGAGAFGGWSTNCTTIAPNPSTAAGPNTCTITLVNDDVVGVVVN